MQILLLRRNKEKGFTLIEVILSAALLAIMLLALAFMQAEGSLLLRSGQVRAKALSLLQSEMAPLLELTKSEIEQKFGLEDMQKEVNGYSLHISFEDRGSYVVITGECRRGFIRVVLTGASRVE